MREGEKEEQTQTNYKLVIIPNKVLTLRVLYVESVHLQITLKYQVIMLWDVEYTQSKVLC